MFPEKTDELRRASIEFNPTQHLLNILFPSEDMLESTSDSDNFELSKDYLEDSSEATPLSDDNKKSHLTLVESGGYGTSRAIHAKGMQQCGLQAGLSSSSVGPSMVPFRFPLVAMSMPALRPQSYQSPFKDSKATKRRHNTLDSSFNIQQDPLGRNNTYKRHQSAKSQYPLAYPLDLRPHSPGYTSTATAHSVEWYTSHNQSAPIYEKEARGVPYSQGVSETEENTWYSLGPPGIMAEEAEYPQKLKQQEKQYLEEVQRESESCWWAEDEARWVQEAHRRPMDDVHREEEARRRMEKAHYRTITEMRREEDARCRTENEARCQEEVRRKEILERHRAGDEVSCLREQLLKQKERVSQGDLGVKRRQSGDDWEKVEYSEDRMAIEQVLFEQELGVITDYEEGFASSQRYRQPPVPNFPSSARWDQYEHSPAGKINTRYMGTHMSPTQIQENELVTSSNHSYQGISFGGDKGNHMPREEETDANTYNCQSTPEVSKFLQPQDEQFAQHHSPRYIGQPWDFRRRLDRYNSDYNEGRQQEENNGRRGGLCTPPFSYDGEGTEAGQFGINRRQQGLQEAINRVRHFQQDDQILYGRTSRRDTRPVIMDPERESLRHRVRVLEPREESRESRKRRGSSLHMRPDDSKSRREVYIPGRAEGKDRSSGGDIFNLRRIDLWREGDRKSVCPVPGCSVRSRKLKVHVYERHLPSQFDLKGKEPGRSTARQYEAQVEALKQLASWLVGQGRTLQDLASYFNKKHTFPSDSILQGPIINHMHALCDSQGWDSPSRFKVNPINSEACLIYWRILAMLVGDLSLDQQGSFRHFIGPMGSTSHPSRVSTSTTRTSSLNIADLTWSTHRSNLRAQPQKSLVPTAVAWIPGRPDAYDSHFHLDRIRDEIFGRGSQKSIQEVLRHPLAEMDPMYIVRVAGGVAVYSDPDTFPEILPRDPCFKSAVGVHPKKAGRLSQTKLRHLVDLFTKNPQVTALGECGLDHSMPPETWAKQEEVLKKVLCLPSPNQAIILHVRGTDQNPYSSDVHSLCARIVRNNRPSHQVLHIHCFTGKTDDVEAWISDFPNTYFGVTAKVQEFDRRQLEALRAIPLNRLLIETDSPHLNPRGGGVNTPNNIGHVAALVAEALGKRVAEVLKHTSVNARSVYQLQ